MPASPGRGVDTICPSVDLVEQIHRATESVSNHKLSMRSDGCKTSPIIPESVIRQKYLENRLPTRAIASEFSCSKTHVRSLLLKYNIPRRHLAFERLLSRIFSYQHSSWILRGGYAMELRLKRARATKDVDLAISAAILANLRTEHIWSSVFDQLVKALAIDLGDFFTFEIRKKPASLFGPPNGGMRFFVDAILGTKLSARFQIDIGAGDVELLPTESLKCKNLLSFAGFDCPLFPVISKEQQFAEKLHAYTTLRKGQVGTRIKDLVDMMLLIQVGMDNEKVTEALHMTFNKRDTHLLPPELPLPRISSARRRPHRARSNETSVRRS